MLYVVMKTPDCSWYPKSKIFISDNHMVMDWNPASDLQQQDPWCFRPSESWDNSGRGEIGDGESQTIEGVSPLSPGIWSGVGQPHQTWGETVSFNGLQFGVKKRFKKQPQKILLAHSWFSIMPKLKGFDSFCNGIFDPEGDNYFWWRPGWLRWWGNWRLAEGSRACQMEARQIGSLFV